MNPILRSFIQKKTMESFMIGFGSGMIYSIILFVRK